MGPCNPSHKRVLPSWLKKVKSVKSSNVADSSKVGGFLDSNNEEKTPSTSGENPTNAEGRTSHKSMFVPQNTILYVMSELELLETAKLILEEDEHSLSPRQQPINPEAHDEDEQQNDNDEEQQNEEHPTDLDDMPDITDNTRNDFKNLDQLNRETANSSGSSHFNLKHTSKRKFHENPDTNKRTDEDPMDVEPPPIDGANPTSGQSKSGVFPDPKYSNKDFIIPLSNPKVDSMPKSPSSTQRKRSRPNLSILDEIFF